MASRDLRRSSTVFGDAKYWAFNMIVAKWLSAEAPVDSDHCYVTMAGTELFDVTNLAWVNLRLVSQVWAFEQDPGRYVEAQKRASQLQRQGISIEAVRADYFTYARRSDDPHIFYVDLPGVVSMSQHVRIFQEWFDRNTLRPGDLILVTSSLRIGAGWQRALEPFDGEFTYLRITQVPDRKRVFADFHPAFVLFRALADAGLDDEVGLRSLGSIRYKSRTVPMGLYGFRCQEGRTELRNLVDDVASFDMVRRTVPEAMTTNIVRS